MWKSQEVFSVIKINSKSTFVFKESTPYGIQFDHIMVSIDTVDGDLYSGDRVYN